MNSVKNSAASNEIDDIMNEIQSLQKGMSSAVSKSATPPPAAQSVKPTAVSAPVAAVAPPPQTVTPVEFTTPDPAPASILEQAIAATEPDEPDVSEVIEASGAGVDEIVATAAAQIANMEPTDSELAQFENAVNSSEVFSDSNEKSSELEPEAETQFETEMEPDQNTAEEAVMSDENHEDGSLTLQLKGNMNLKLKYEIDGQEVTIGFVDQQLRVMLADGTEFRVPLHRGGRHLKAA